MKLDKSQTIALLLFAALIINAVVHFTSPAYRYYRQQFDLVEKRLNSKYDLFSSSVRTNVTDAVVEFYTNIVAMLQQERRDAFVSKDIVSDEKKDDTPILPLVDNISYDYGFVDGTDIATIGRQHYKVGQVFPRGGLITSVSSDCIILDGRYRVGNNFKSREVEKNASD